MKELGPVQYATTVDGLSIAYVAMRRGMPLVYLPGQFSSLQHLREDLNDGPWTEMLAARYRLVRYDSRGQGMSTRGMTEAQTIETLGYDLDAVVDKLGLTRFVVFARWYAAHIAIRYAVAHPERVAALILDGCAEDNSRWPESVYLDLPDQNWEVFMLSQMPKEVSFDQARRRMAQIDDAVQPADLAIRARACRASNVTKELPRVKVPTLVLHPRNYLMVAAAESMNVAARIPGARFSFIDGEMLPGDAVTGLKAIDDFLRELELPEDAFEPPSLPLSGGTNVATAGLSPRQRQVLQLIALGKTNREIAGELVLSERTVQRHIADLYLKIDVRNRAEAVGYARDHALRERT